MGYNEKPENGYVFFMACKMCEAKTRAAFVPFENMTYEYGPDDETELALFSLWNTRNGGEKSGLH